MPIIGETRFLERPQFFNGQRLFASDLQGLEEFHRQMRWLHNESCHQPGVGKGLGVLGEADASEVRIDPGYAIDALGREIVLTEGKIEPVPPVANDGFGGPVYYDLTVAYPEDRDLEESETREGICLPRGVIRLEERPVFCWVRLGAPPEFQPVDDQLKLDLQSGMKIRLARAEVLECRLKSSLSIAQRRNARPPTQPYVSCGRVSLEDAEITAVDESTRFLMSVPVDTSSAGFRTNPCYFASLVGPRVFAPPDGDQDFIVDGITSISIPPANPLTRFDLHFVGFVFGLTAASPELLSDRLREAWQVEWIGVEG
jgi:hypothetical protein